MKTTCLIFLLFPMYLLAQDSNTDILNPDRLPFKKYHLIAERIAPSSVKLPFSSIKIMDSRFDTSKIGYVYTRNLLYDKKNAFKKLQLSEGMAGALEKYYKDYYEEAFDKSGFRLLIVIKRFWVSGIDYQKTKGYAFNKDLTYSLHCKWEYYLGKDDEYLPVKRLDTTWRLNEDINKYVKSEFDEKHQEFIKFVLKANMELFDFSKAIAVYDQQNKRHISEIIAFNAKRFNLPVLTDTAFAKGVFLNFEEFQNNKPSILLFKEKEIKYQLTRSESFIEDEGGNRINPYWGYFDGINFKYDKYVRSKLYRVQNTFGFFIKLVWYNYDNDIVDYAGIVTNNVLLANNDRKGIWVPYQIDMETGEVY